MRVFKLIIAGCVEYKTVQEYLFSASNAQNFSLQQSTEKVVLTP
jgi:hypothetical protein